MNRLIYETEGKPVEVALTDKPVSFGRSDEADHKLPTKLASRIHAQVFPREGGWWVEDLGSSNGTGLDGKKITRPTPLAPGNVVSIGDIELKFEGDAPRPKGPPDHLVARVMYSPGKGAKPVDTLIHQRITIGRKPENTLQIENKAISSQHCEIVNRGGAYILRDLGSSNGTFVNGRRVTEHTLRNGDKVVLGKKVDLYFMDPAAAQGDAKQAPKDEPAAPAPRPPSGRKPAAKASSAPGGSERGTFAPVGDAPEKKRANPVPFILVGVGIGAVFALSGWLLGSVIAGMAERTVDKPEVRTPERALADRLLSFEGEIDGQGNPEGWIASYEARGDGKIELLADPSDPWDGERSLAVINENPSVQGTLILQTEKPRKIDLGGGFNVGIHMKGEGVTRVALALCVVDGGGNVQTVAAGSFIGIKGTQWTQLNAVGAPVTELPGDAHLRLLISAGFSKLWIDRLEIVKTKETPNAQPFTNMDAGLLEFAFAEGRPATTEIRNRDGAPVRFQPRLLAFDDSNVSEDELWAVAAVKPRAVNYTAMMPSRANAAAMTFEAGTYDNGYFTDNGVKLDWTVTQGPGVTLGVDVVLPFSRHAELVVADRRGMPLAVDRNAVHAYAYSTVSEIVVGEADISVSFPRGAVVWLDFSRRDRLVATVRAPMETARKGMSLHVNSRPLMFARLYERIYKEGVRMMNAEHYSAAIERFNYLTNPNRPDRDVPVIALAQRKLNEIEVARAELETAVDEAWDRVTESRNTQTVRDAKKMVLRYLAEFPGDARAETMADRRDLLNTWEAQLELEARTPDEMEEAEKIARELYAAAEQSYDSGNLLLALVMLENIQRDYADTSRFIAARTLMEEINAQLDDVAERDRVIDKELAGIDEDIKFEDYNRARQRCVALFKRFPDTDRNRDIMKRLRAIESAFED